MPASIVFGEVTADTMEGVHPGGVTVFRLTGGGRKVVFITDCTLTEGIYGDLVRFARDCDLLLIDGQYNDAEWPSRSTFGHNTWKMAARFGAECGAKTVRIIHHDPTRLDAAASELTAIHPRCAFARDREEILL